MGAAAFARGIGAAPCLDGEFMQALGNGPIGGKRTAVLIVLMDAWSKGWHAANVAAPVQAAAV